jgi:hypothetical protein
MPEEVSVQTDREHDFWLAEKLLERQIAQETPELSIGEAT